MNAEQKREKKVIVATKAKVMRASRISRPSKFSPAWVVLNAKDAPGYKMELINRIRDGVKKSDWKLLINNINSSEKEFENILPSSISSMQKSYL